MTTVVGRQKNVETSSSFCEDTSGDKTTKFWKHKISVTAGTTEWFQVKSECRVGEDGKKVSTSGVIYTGAGQFSHKDMLKCQEAILEVLDWGNSPASRCYGPSDEG